MVDYCVFLVVEGTLVILLYWLCSVGVLPISCQPWKVWHLIGVFDPYLLGLDVGKATEIENHSFCIGYGEGGEQSLWQRIFIFYKRSILISIYCNKNLIYMCVLNHHFFNLSNVKCVSNDIKCACCSTTFLSYVAT